MQIVFTVKKCILFLFVYKDDCVTVSSCLDVHYVNSGAVNASSDFISTHQSHSHNCQEGQQHNIMQ